MPNKNIKKKNIRSNSQQTIKIMRPYAHPGGTTVNQTGSWRTNRPQINYEKCISCGLCIKLCPEPCISWKKINKKNKPVIDYCYCKGCGLCAKECPVKAITMLKDYH